MDDYHIRLAGDAALVVDFGNRVEISLSNKVLALAQELNALHLDGVLETVPTTRSLSVYYEPLTISTTELESRISGIVDHLQTAVVAGRSWRIPVCYDPSLAPDLKDVAERCRLSIDQVVELHSGTVYHAYMLGFLPGLAYLGDIAEKLALPRRNAPRARVPAGSLGIAERMTTIFPMATPSGWHMIGRSPAVLWQSDSGAALNAGDKVHFAPISLAEFERVQNDCAPVLIEVSSTH